MQDEKLIECVKNYEFLYNLQHPKYMDNDRKNMAWKDISEQINQPAEACKLRWQTLRDAYRRALNKRKSKSGPAAEKIKKWKYEEEMSFVSPFLIERRSEPMEMSNDEVVQNNHATIENPLLGFRIIKTDASDDNVSDNLGPTQVPIDENIRRNSSPTRGSINRTQGTQGPTSSRLQEDQNPSKHDAIDYFFLGISGTVKKFNEYQQAVLKNKIFGLVFETEMQVLGPSTDNQNSIYLQHSNMRE